MSSRLHAGAVLYVSDVERIAAFYAGALGFTLKVREEKTAVLETSVFQLIVLQAHGRQVPALKITSPPARRSSATLKLVFFVDSIAKVREAANAHGGVMNASAKEWTFGEWCVCDGLDPEGNVIQVREPAK